MTSLSYADLVARLSDLERLAVPPLPGERCGTWSSYDRRSQYDAAQDMYVDWNANSDGGGYIREDGDRIVVFEADGPGCIWRIWSAWPQQGHVEIYIDDEPEPVIDMPFRDLFGGVGLLDYNLPELATVLSRGHNRYIPIPYNHSCRILMAPGWGRFYHFTYSTFPAETRLPEFTGAPSPAEEILLAEKDRELAFRGWRFLQDQTGETLVTEVSLSPGGSLCVADLAGNGAITALRVVPDAELVADAEAGLREIALSIHWDGEVEPSVWSPLGDFFGSAPGIQHFRALPVGMTPSLLYSQWFMPYSDGARVWLQNDGTQIRRLRCEVTHRPLPRDAKELLRFHAKWHPDAFVEKSQGRGRDIDWPLLNVQGQGRFCGVHLHVWNRWIIPEAQPSSWWYGKGPDKTIDWWWGEGDEKFFVDGEKFPSSFGTGSEDYIGYAWAAEPPFPIFESPFACQPYTPIDGNGHTSVNRFHICDNIPFQTSFEGCIEKYKGNRWGPNDANVCIYDAVAYWYQAAGQTDPYQAYPLSARVDQYMEPSPAQS